MKLISKLLTGWQPINQLAIKEWSDNWKSRTTKSRVLLGRGVESDKQYTERRKRETAPLRTWRSDAADVAHGVGVGASIAGLVGGLALAPTATVGGLVLGTVGNKVTDKVTSKLSNDKYPTWAKFLSDKTGISENLSEMTNPGMWLGGARGYKYGNFFNGKTFWSSKLAGNKWSEAAIDAVADSPTGKRAAEVLMRSRYDTHATLNPIFDITQGWMNAPWNRRRAVLDYVFTGGDFSKTGNKPFGYKESLAPFKFQGDNAPSRKGEITFNTKRIVANFRNISWKDKLKTILSRKPYDNSLSTTWYNWGEYLGEPEVAYTGGFWSKHLPRRKGYGDAIDSFLYGTEIDPAYGMKRISIGKPEDFGMHREYIAENYPSKTKDILVYETTPYNGDDIVISLVKPKGYFASHRGDIKTGSNSNFDAGGHWREFGYQLDKNGEPQLGTMYQLYRNGKPWMSVSKLPSGIDKQSVVTYTSEVKPLEAYRSLDIYKFLPKDYKNSWGIGGLGVRFIDNAGTPFLTRTPWRKIPQQIFTE